MTIAKWIDQGVLPGHTTPGGHRRVKSSDLVRYLNQHGMPVPTGLAAAEHRVLAVHRDPDFLAQLGGELSAESDKYEYRGTTRGVDAMILLGEWRPGVILLDLDLEDVDSLQVCRYLSEVATDYGVRVVALASGLNDDSAVARAAIQAGAERCVSGDSIQGELLHVLTDMNAENGATARTQR